MKTEDEIKHNIYETTIILEKIKLKYMDQMIGHEGYDILIKLKNIEGKLEALKWVLQ